MFKVQEKTMTFSNVQNVSIRQGPMQRLFGIADLEVRTAGGGSSSDGNAPNEQGENLFKQVITCVGSDNGRNFTDYYADILLSMNKKYYDNLCNWMSVMLREPNFPSHRVTHAQKEQFAQLVLRERANKRKLLEIVREFNLACNGLISNDNSVAAAYERIEDKQAAKLLQSDA